MKFIENKFYGVTTKGVLHTFIESYSNFPITFFNIFKAPFTSALISLPSDTFIPRVDKILFLVNHFNRYYFVNVNKCFHNYFLNTETSSSRPVSITTFERLELTTVYSIVDVFEINHLPGYLEHKSLCSRIMSSIRS